MATDWAFSQQATTLVFLSQMATEWALPDLLRVSVTLALQHTVPYDALIVLVYDNRCSHCTHLPPAIN
jgi:hypothetical protein